MVSGLLRSALLAALLLTPSAAGAQPGAGGPVAAWTVARQEPLPDPYGVPQTWTSRDKWYHFGVSAVAAGTIYSGSRWLGLSRWPAVAVAVGVTGAVGWLREVHDDRRGKYFSQKDLLWNAAGITVGIAIPDQLLFRSRRAEAPE